MVCRDFNKKNKAIHKSFDENDNSTINAMTVGSPLRKSFVFLPNNKLVMSQNKSKKTQ